MDSGQLLMQWKFHKEEATRLMNLVVDNEMLDEVDQLDEMSNQPCDDEKCQQCKKVYQRSKLVNRATGSLYEFKESYKCGVTSDKKPWSGVYGIICVHPTCPKRGVIYFGEANDICKRILQHMNTISGTHIRPRAVQNVHRHFWTHNDNPDPLYYFRIAMIQEEKDVTKRHDLETKLMDEFFTRGGFGFNIRQSKPEYEFVVSPEMPKSNISKSRTPPEVEKKSKKKEKYSDVSAGLLAALAIKSQKRRRDNPQRGIDEASAGDITSFIDVTFEYAYQHATMLKCLSKAAGNEPGGFREPYNNWFEGELRQRIGHPPQIYVYRLSSQGNEDFNEWVNSPAPDNEVKALLKPNSNFGEDENYKIEEHYDALISGKMLEVSPLVKTRRL